METKLVHFLRQKDYVLVKELGQGACGKTVLLQDQDLQENFVCKKYLPFSEQHREELYEGFVREIKLLHRIHHPNVVRVFNYYLYKKVLSGYILMEYIEGPDVEIYLKANPERTNDIFEQALKGFQYLEANNILHRDIRTQNILVGADGVLKIIDLGFGKQVNHVNDFDKSITLNWWCETPNEFSESIYDFKSEIYFVGKLFEKLIKENDIQHFKYTHVLRKMCEKDPNSRIDSFHKILDEIQSDLFYEIEFEYDEKEAYRKFANSLNEAISKIDSGTKYHDDLEKIKSQLEIAYQQCMLEETIPDCAPVLRCFLNGNFYYTSKGFEVSVLQDFIRLLKSIGAEKQKIILANLHTRLNSIKRYTQNIPSNFDDFDDIPF